MARNWLRQALLPSEYWYFTVKRACEIANIMPTNHLPKSTTPFELVFGKPADYRQLFPMFSASYIKQAREHGTGKNKWKSQSLKCIAVGKCSDSNGILFYHPPSKQILTCGNGYKFDTFSPAGVQFDLKFDGNFVMSTESTTSAIHRPPSHEEGSTKYIQGEDTDSYIQVKILSAPIDDDTENYIVQEIQSGNIHEVLAEKILPSDPTADPTQITTSKPFPHLPWLYHDKKSNSVLTRPNATSETRTCSAKRK
jgi:hypothetical protein